MDYSAILDGLENHRRFWNPGTWHNAEFILKRRNFRTEPGRKVSLANSSESISAVQGGGPDRKCPITRSEVRRFFDIALEEQGANVPVSRTATCTAFIAMMAWGNGDTGYGPFRASVALSLPTWDGRDSVDALGDVLGGFRRGSLTIEQAYNSLNGLLRGIGPAFFTKLMYFASPDTNRAPILDAVVASALNEGLGERFEIRGRQVKPRAQPASVDMYMAYVNWCGKFTTSIEGRRDLPEYVLFNDSISNKTEALQSLRLRVPSQ